MTRDVLVDGYTLFVGDPERPGVSSGDDGGLYYRDTRHLSSLTVGVEGAELSTLGRDLPGPDRRTVVATAGDSSVNRVDEREHKRSDLVVTTAQSVAAGTGLDQQVAVVNHSAAPFAGRLAVGFGADFADVFEVRGFDAKLSRDPSTTVDDRTVTYVHGYERADGAPVTRSTTLAFDPAPTSLAATEASFDVDLGPQARATVDVSIRPERSVGEGGASDGGSIANTVRSEHARGDRSDDATVSLPTVVTGRESYDRVFARAGEDLAALSAATPHGPVPLAGAPWFATVFGRDALIAAYQALPVAPALADGTLRYLAAHQGTTVDDASEEAPGKMFHEMRSGELADRGTVPHSPYYGSVDATPLWVVLLAERYRWTGDDDLVGELADALAAALDWIDRTRAATGADPFLYYEQSPTMGLLHKAWRDTPGSVQSPDGEVADPPIASVEVQGYVHRALRDAADLYDTVLDDGSRADELREEADRLAAAFDETFWLADQGYYALAKDGQGDLVETRTSNVGHCLWSGLVPADRAGDVAAVLRADDLFTGWGIRTVAASAAGYSPVSYHLGSVWPHDTSLTALGLARYGFHDDADRLARGVLDACTRFDDERIPELFCGFGDDLAPKPYASSCVPQAWSAGAPYALLRAAFDLDPAADGVDVGHDSDVLVRTALEPVMRRWKE